MWGDWWVVLLVGCVAQLALFYGIGLLEQTAHYLGIPGAAAALFGVLAAIAAGPVIGGTVALVGGVAFVIFVADFGGFVDPAVIVVAIALWTLAAIVAGLAARFVRRRGAAREALLSRALAESEGAKAAVESILALAPAFHSFEQYDDMIKAICAGARDTFASRSASLYSYADGRLLLLGRDPSHPLFPVGWQAEATRIPGLVDDLASGLCRFVPDTALEIWPDRESDMARALGLRSVLRIPILLAPSSAFLLVIGWEQVQESLDPTRFALAQRFADQAAVALEHAEAEALHKRLERSLLSRSLDPHPWLDIHIRYRSGERRLGLGGDFVDYVVHDDQTVRFVIGDVSGHGPDAAALGATLRSAWRGLADAETPPRQTLDALNKVLYSERSNDNFYCTLLAGRIDASTGSLTLANAGHPPPLVIAKEARLLLVKPVLPLGCEHDDGWRLEVFQLPRAWSLLFYTDGLFEGALEPGSSERYGIDRLTGRFAQAAPGPISVGLLDEVMLELEEANGKPPPDDVAVLLVSKRDETAARV